MRADDAFPAFREAIGSAEGSASTLRSFIGKSAPDFLADVSHTHDALGDVRSARRSYLNELDPAARRAWVETIETIEARLEVRRPRYLRRNSRT